MTSMQFEVPITLVLQHFVAECFRAPRWNLGITTFNKSFGCMWGKGSDFKNRYIAA